MTGDLIFSTRICIHALKKGGELHVLTMYYALFLGNDPGLVPQVGLRGAALQPAAKVLGCGQIPGPQRLEPQAPERRGILELHPCRDRERRGEPAELPQQLRKLLGLLGRCDLGAKKTQLGRQAVAEQEGERPPRYLDGHFLFFFCFSHLLFFDLRIVVSLRVPKGEAIYRI